jgi:uncharacterized protein
LILFTNLRQQAQGGKAVARLTYLAPAVYVEEIPSARQPIAGVGTNTAGFIGLIPEDVVFVPEPNPDYDPMQARSLMNYRQLAASERSVDKAAAAKQLEGWKAALTKLETDATDLRNKVGPAEQEAKNADNEVGRRNTAVQQLPPNVPDDQRQAALQALAEAQRVHTEKEAALKKIQEDLAQKQVDANRIRKDIDEAATAGGAAVSAWVEREDETYETVPPSRELTIPSRFRPYVLKPVKITAESCSTKLCTNFTEYTDKFGWFSGFKDTPENPNDDPMNWVFKPLHPGHHYLTHAVSGFFRNGGTRCFVARIKQMSELDGVLSQFESIEDVAILAAPGLPKSVEVWEDLESYCEDDSRPNVFAVLDAPAVVNDETSNTFDLERLTYEHPKSVMAPKSNHAAFYFPHVEVVDPAKEMQDADPDRQVPPKYRGRTHVAPSGHIAGVYARTDEERGVHKAPANAVVRGAIEVKYYISKPKQELLNPTGVNCIRLMDGNVTVWGARTAGGEKNGEWMYVNVRRFAGFLEQSIMNGTQWVVFEPNDPNLWSRIILNVTAFLTNVWRSGALFGLTPQEAFYVKCDEELNTAEVRDLGQVVTEIGVAIVRPAEFVIFRITQMAGRPG